MQDRLKFRFWHKPTNKMLDCYGFNEHCTFANTLDGIGTEYNPCATKDCKLMQCTGLKDKNGKLVYEGDILGNIATFKGKTYQAPLEVVWEKGNFWLQGSYTTNKGTLRFVGYNINEVDFFEVIGNIYENEGLINE